MEIPISFKYKIITFIISKNKFVLFFEANIGFFKMHSAKIHPTAQISIFSSYNVLPKISSGAL